MGIQSWVGRTVLIFGAMLSIAHAAQPMRFERLGLDEGLSQLAVNAIAQDAQGFLWVGTEEGLDRYDGYSFRHFRHDRTNPRSLANDFIGDIAVDAQGALWVATDGGGVVRRDPVSGDFTPLDIAAADSTGLERVRMVRFDRAGRLWIATREAGIAVFDPQLHKLTRFQHVAANPNTLINNSVFALLEDRRGEVWIGTEQGGQRLTPGTGRFERVNLQAAEDPPRRIFSVRALLEDHRGAIWLGTDAGLTRIDPTTGARTHFRPRHDEPGSIPEGPVNILLEDAQQRLWVGMDNGLALFDRASGTFKIYRHDPADPASLPDNQIISLYKDRGGLLWIGTKFGGLVKWNPRTWSFGHRLASAEEGYASSNIIAFTEDRVGRLFVGSIGGGLVMVDRRTAMTSPITHLSDDRIMTLLTDREGIVWAGTMRGGLNRIDPETLKVDVFAHNADDAHSLGAHGVMCLLEDSKGRLWVGTFGGGLNRYDPRTQRFVRYEADLANPAKLESGRVTALAEDRNGRIWAGTDGGGLHVLDAARGQFFRLNHDAGDPQALSADTVYSIHVDGRGDVWVGTRGGGLDLAIGSSLEPAAIRFKNLSERDGLPNDTIYGIRGDAEGMLWLSSNRGLARFDPRTGAVRAFHRNHGLQGEEFNFGAHYANRAGELYFGGANGYNVFKPAGLQFSTAPPPVVLTSISRSGRPLAEPLRLDARNNAITFEFAALDFAMPRANLFQYWLEGFEPRWTMASSQRSATYTNLDGGQYKLHVRAANADGVWNQKGFDIAFEVRPSPWKTGWAYAGCAVLFALLLRLAWLAHRRVIKREARYSRKLEAEVRKRTLELEVASLSDALTGLGNRRALIRAMPRIVAEARNESMALLVVDLDNLKPINDEHGHEAGDRVLAGVSAILRECLSEGDRAVRWGGDEFVMVKAGVGLDEAAALAERIRASLAERRFPLAGGLTARTSCSIGFALYPFVSGAPEFLNWEQVLNLADVALYRAKTRRNAWVGWSGKPAAVTAPDLTAMLAAELNTGNEDDYVASRSSMAATVDDLLTAAI